MFGRIVKEYVTKKEWMNKPVGTRLFLYPPISNQLLNRGVIELVKKEDIKIPKKRRKSMIGYKNKMQTTYNNKGLGG